MLDAWRAALVARPVQISCVPLGERLENGLPPPILDVEREAQHRLVEAGRRPRQLLSAIGRRA
jgi:hypothetical protein